MRNVILVLAFTVSTVLRSQDLSVQIVSWNVESDGARISTIAQEIRQDFEGIELWGLSEVAGDEAAGVFESSAEEGENIDYGRIVGTTGGRDRLVILFDSARFELREAFELDEINVSGTVRAPLVARLRDSSTGTNFSFMVNHLYRGSSAGRHRQAELLNEWAAIQTEPVIAVGDYNFDWHYQTGDEDHDEGYDNMIANGRWEWIRPQVLVPTNSSGHESVLDFVFFTATAAERPNWDTSSEILVRPNDYPDGNLKSDHRPVLATFERFSSLAKAISPPAMVLQPSSSLRRAIPLAKATSKSADFRNPPQIPVETNRPAPAKRGADAAIEYKILTQDHPALERSDEGGLQESLGRQGVAAPEFVITRSKRWRVGETITVAFRGGSKELHKQVADVASRWLKYGNLKFDFGVDNNGNHRSWSQSDLAASAYIRISFDRRGYYSLVGTDALNPQNASAGEETMNFGGFAERLPQDWAATVLHEFGHALGFEHEHQHPAGGCDFRWDDDIGYVRTLDQRRAVIVDSQGRRPGIYSVLGGWPNEWDRPKVDRNLRQLANSSAYLTSGFDGQSVMKYPFDAWMFAQGAQSKCYSTQDNSVLSKFDQEGIATAYPFEARQMEERNKERIQAIEVLQRVIERSDVKAALESIKNRN